MWLTKLLAPASGRSLLRNSAIIATLITLFGCAPDVGSERWCEAMAEKPKGDWTANEALAYAEHCLID
jgi:hypothetical protein